MERLTERKYGEIVSAKKEKEQIHCSTFCNDCSQGAGNCHYVKEMVEKLAEYEQAEEQGLLKMLPVAIGSDVYYIPSKVNYKLNVLGKHEEHNRVYHQKVERISFNQRGWYLECDKDLEYGTGHILVDVFYKETWFTSEAEAEQALAKMKGE